MVVEKGGKENFRDWGKNHFSKFEKVKVVMKLSVFKTCGEML